MASEDDERFLREAIELARASVEAGGGPFGALVVRKGRVLARGTNEVTLAGDPTAHAEVVAIRAACRALGDFRLAGCTVYASCEPCPMCLGALWWARVERVVHAATRSDAAAAGFDDEELYAELVRPLAERRLPLVRLRLSESSAPFEAWRERAGRVPY